MSEETAETMQLHYVTTADDQIAKLERFADMSWIARAFSISTYLLICGLAWFATYRFYLISRNDDHRFIAAGAVALVLTLTLPALYRWYQSSFFKSVLSDEKLRGLIGPTNLLVDDEGIAEIGPMLTLRFAWNEITEVTSDDKRLIILAAPLIAVVVPYSAFGDRDDASSFEDLVKARAAKAGRQGPL